MEFAKKRDLLDNLEMIINQKEKQFNDHLESYTDPPALEVEKKNYNDKILKRLHERIRVEKASVFNLCSQTLELNKKKIKAIKTLYNAEELFSEAEEIIAPYQHVPWVVGKAKSEFLKRQKVSNIEDLARVRYSVFVGEKTPVYVKQTEDWPAV